MRAPNPKMDVRHEGFAWVKSAPWGPVLTLHSLPREMEGKC